MIVSQKVFSTGIIDKGLLARSDSTLYKQGLLQLDNMNCSVFGGIEKRTGTNFVSDMNNADKSKLVVSHKDYRYSMGLTADNNNVRYITFSGTPSISSQNITKDYVIVLTHKKLAIFDTSFNGDKSKYKNLIDKDRFGNPTLEGFTALSVANGVVTWSMDTEYTDSQIKDIKVTQSKDTMFLCHTNHRPKVLVNQGKFFVLPDETSDIPPKRTAVSGTEVYWIFKDFAFYNKGLNSGNAKARGLIESTLYPSDWAIGKVANEPIFPSTVVIYQNRLVFAGSGTKPLGIWFSKSGNYADFSILNDKEEVAPEVSIHTLIDSGLNEKILWVTNGKTLTIGTSHSEYILSTGAKGLSSLDMSIVPQTRLGSSGIQPIQINNELIFVQTNSLSISKFIYSFDQNQYTTENLSITIPELLSLRIIDMCLVNSYTPTIILLTEDGNLLRLLHDKTQKVTGYSKLSITDGSIISITPVKNPVSGSDTVYMCIRRVNKVNKDITYSMEKFQDKTLVNNYDAKLSKYYTPYLDSHSNHYSITDSVSGLYRFNGYKQSDLVIHSNGNEYSSTSDDVIINGKVSIRLPDTDDSKYMTIGLAVNSKLITLPLDIPSIRNDNSPSGSNGSVTYKSTSNIYMNLLNAGLFMKVRVFNKVNKGSWITKSFRKSSDVLGVRSELFEGITDNLIVGGNFSNVVQMEIVHTGSSPFTILAIHIEVQ